MATWLYTHPACLDHDPGSYHPESAARLRAVLDALDEPEFAGLERREAPPAALEDLLRVHRASHVERILAAVPKTGHVAIDATTEVMTVTLKDVADRDLWATQIEPKRRWPVKEARRA